MFILFDDERRDAGCKAVAHRSGGRVVPAATTDNERADGPLARLNHVPARRGVNLSNRVT